MREIRIREFYRLGLQGSRPAQEDYVLLENERRIFTIADGFGGPVAGVEASKRGCEAVRDYLKKEAGDEEATLPFVLRSYYSLAGNVLFNSLIHANRKILKWNEGKSVHERGGASVLSGYVDGDLLALANAGACSAWLIRGGQARELVQPRSLARLRDPFSEGQEQFPLMALGLVEDLEPELVEVRLQEGDWVAFETQGFLTQERREAILSDLKAGKSLSDRFEEWKELKNKFNQLILMVKFGF